MTTRDLFAAHAMAAIVAAQVQLFGDSPLPNRGFIAADAFDMADAMMEERHRRKQPKADEAL